MVLLEIEQGYDSLRDYLSGGVLGGSTGAIRDGQAALEGLFIPVLVIAELGVYVPIEEHAIHLTHAEARRT